MSRYIPVAAKRRALAIYRDRRRGGGFPGVLTPRNPLAAMNSTLEFFAGHLAFCVVHGDDERVKPLADGYRAAEYYLARMYQKPWRHGRGLVD